MQLLPIREGSGSLISHHIPGDNTAGWDTERTHKHSISPHVCSAVKLHSATYLSANTHGRSFTCDFESRLAIRQLQSEQPTEQLSYWCDRHQSPAGRLGYLTNQRKGYSLITGKGNTYRSKRF